GRDNAYCFAELNKLTRRQIASITHRAHTAPALTSENRTNLQTLHAHPLKLRSDLFVNQLIRFDDLLFLIHRISNRLATYASDYALAEIDYFFIALVNRAHHNPVYRTAILFIDDHVLRGVDQLARQISRIGSL